jgi:DNA-binding transcriptional MerR regulator
MGIVESQEETLNMPVLINGQTFYQTAEACRIAGISKNTILRWIREGMFADVELRDRRGWRLFSDDDLDRLRAEVSKIYRNHIAQSQAILLGLR